MKKFFLLFIAFLLVKNTVSNAQSSKKEYADYQKGDIEWYISPLALMEPSSTAMVGVEYYLRNEVSLHTDLGYVFGHMNSVDEEDGRVNTWGAKLEKTKLNMVFKPEVRFYNESNPLHASYYGVRLLLRNLNFRKEQSYFEEYEYNKSFNIWTPIGERKTGNYYTRRQTIGVQFLVGWKRRFIKNSIFNPYTGFGVRYVSNRPIGKKFNPENSNATEEGFPLVDFYTFDKKYKFIMLDFALGFRFGGGIKRHQKSPKK